MCEVHCAEIGLHTEICNEVPQDSAGCAMSGRALQDVSERRYHWLLREGASADLNVGIGGHAWLQDRPSELIVVDPGNVLIYMSVKVVVNGN